MNKRLLWKWVGIFLLSSINLLPATRIHAQPVSRASSSNAYDVVDAVNSLRISHGLPAYSISSILMGTAQGQADYMASSGSITHTGPDGSRPYQRGLAAGYPLAGQIPPGFYSENIVGSPGMTSSDAISSWMGDSAHQNTMLSPNLTEIGAGVAESGGMVYYVIDCARPTGSGLPQAYTPGADEAQLSAGENEIIIPVVESTPDANGEVVHVVQAGQSLWQIAISYGVKIADIRQLNNFSSSYVINPGDKLLIKKQGTATPNPPTMTATLSEPTSELIPTVITSTDSPTASITPTLVAPVSGSVITGGAVAAIAVVALAAAGLVAWLGRSRPI
jgi:uncharacterized protein YkwD